MKLMICGAWEKFYFYGRYRNKVGEEEETRIETFLYTWKVMMTALSKKVGCLVKFIKGINFKNSK